MAGRVSQPPCIRSGCPHMRRSSAPRQHGYCCSLCRYGPEYGHTPNCTGYDHPQRWARHPSARWGNGHEWHSENQPAAAWGNGNDRWRDTRSTSGASSRRQGTGWGEDSWHGTSWEFPAWVDASTASVGGSVANASPLPQLRSACCGVATGDASQWQRRASREGVRPALPRSPDTSVLEYVRALTSAHGLDLSARAEQAWARFEERLGWARFAERVLLLEPHKQNSIPVRYQDSHLDVATLGVDGRCPRLYELPDVTGVDARVQAVVASQDKTALGLAIALECIEEQDLHEFSFVCHGATHRSVACCLLLAAIAYPQARVRFSTPRTRAAATVAGLR